MGYRWAKLVLLRVPRLAWARCCLWSAPGKKCRRSEAVWRVLRLPAVGYGYTKHAP